MLRHSLPRRKKKKEEGKGTKRLDVRGGNGALRPSFAIFVARISQKESEFISERRKVTGAIHREDLGDFLQLI